MAETMAGSMAGTMAGAVAGEESGGIEAGSDWCRDTLRETTFHWVCVSLGGGRFIQVLKNELTNEQVKQVISGRIDCQSQDLFIEFCDEMENTIDDGRVLGSFKEEIEDEWVDRNFPGEFTEQDIHRIYNNTSARLSP